MPNLTPALIQKTLQTLTLPTQPPLNNPLLIQLVGLPACGKTFFASRLSAEIPLVILNGQNLRKKIFPQAEFSDQENRFLYDLLIPELIKHLASSRYTILLDANIDRRLYREKNYTLARSLNLRPLTIYLTCPQKILTQRFLEKRQNPWLLAQTGEYIAPSSALAEAEKTLEPPTLTEPYRTFRTHRRSPFKFKRLLTYLKK